ncbi:hypothetical protein BDZ85DRAFT_2325 [Elsinoe ampelina]|uniref:Uncharacterized protein n=1 Tax=Elsinoe ampelina TaxID=302913 RepID=A0A6A6GP00_9PEZI|nr:hypothetical protein BDZ85DRAFT_2325 [Elsinoe ampelina]
MESASSGPWSVLRYLGGWGHSRGPGRFMIQMLLFGTGTASVLGFVVSMIAASFYDTAALPFMVSSIIGFGVGCVNYYRASLARAMIDLDRYPTLLRLSLDSEFPTQRFDLRPQGYFTSRNFDRTWQDRSRLLVGWLSAGDNIAAIRSRKEQDYVDRGGETISEKRSHAA